MLRAALVTPLSGPLAGYGRAGAAALGLWADWHSERFSAAELLVLDAHPDPAAAVRRAAEFRPDLVFGPYGSGPAAAVAAATSRLVWNHGGARVQRAANAVPVLAAAETYFQGALRAVRAADASARSVCLLSGGTGFSRAVAAGAAGEAERLGLRVRSAGLPAETADLAESRKRGAGGAAGSPPGGTADPADAAESPDGGAGAAGSPPGDHPEDADVLLAVGTFAAEVAAARRLLPGRWRAAGFVSAGVTEILDSLGGAREGLLGPAQWLAGAAPEPDEGPTAAVFAALYRRAAGADPPYPAAQAFAAGVIASRCLRDAGRADDAALLAAARVLDCTTMFGRFRLDPETHAQVGHQVLTVQWQDGVRRVIWPAERAEAPLRYPLP